MKNILFILILSMSFFVANIFAKDVSLEAKISSLYISFFNRAADENGLNYWTELGEAAANNGENPLDVLKLLAASFALHPTFIATYDGMDNESFVKAIYRNSLGREGDIQGIAYWKGLLDNGKSRSDMVAEFMELSLTLDLTSENFPLLSQEELEAAIERQNLISNKVEVGIYFTRNLGSKTNVVDELDPENDPAYLASIKVLSEVGVSRESITSATDKIAQFITEIDPINMINNNWEEDEEALFKTVRGRISDAVIGLDNPIENVKVFIDLNLNNLLDEGEPYDVTDEDGSYTINAALESEEIYLLIALGESINNTSYSQDFLMFGEILLEDFSEAEIENNEYVKNIQPILFKAYLTDTNEEFYKSLGVNNIVVRVLLDEYLNSDDEGLFEKYILGRRDVISSTLYEVAESIKQRNSNNMMLSSKENLNISLEDSLSFSDDNSSTLSQTLYYQNKTKLNKVKNLVFAKKLSLYDQIDEYDVFLTKYTNILEIPNYQQLHDTNYTFVDGSDIRIKKNGVDQLSSTAIMQDLVSSYEFNKIDNKVDFFQYIDSTWTLKASNVSIDELKNRAFILAPFVVVQKASFHMKSYTLSGFDIFSDPIVIIKGKIDTLDSQSEVISYQELPINGEIEIKVKDNYIVDEVIVISEDLIDITPDKKNIVALEVQGDTIVQESDSITPYINVTDEETKSLILKGSLVESYIGLESMIDTHRLYQNLSVGKSLIDDIDANDILMTNINNFLTGTNVFFGGSENQIQFGSNILEVNSSVKTIELNSINYSGKEIQDEVNAIWKFSDNTVKRTIHHVYMNGDKEGTSYTSEYIFEYKNSDNGIQVEFIEDVIEKNEYSNYNDYLEANYNGSAVFQRSLDDSVSKIFSSTFSQERFQENSKGSKNYLDGVVSILDMPETIDEAFDGTLAFEGDFLLQNGLSRKIQGNVKVSSEDTLTVLDENNNNNISNAIILLKEFTFDTPSSLFIGNWNGVFSNTCTNIDGMMTIDFDTLSWFGYDGAQSYYGTSISIEDDVAILYNNVKKWGSVELNGETGNGIWSENSCEGTLTLSK